MNTKLIGFTGRAGAGKSTACFLLKDRKVLPGKFTERMRFAGPMKDAMKALGLSPREYDGDLKETPCELLCGKTPRFAMQTLGTEWGRQMIDENLWVKNFRIRAQRVLDGGGNVLVDDVRFENEVATLKDMGGIIIRIERPGETIAESGHASEQQQLAHDHLIVNDSTDLDGFARKLIGVLYQ